MKMEECNKNADDLSAGNMEGAIDPESLLSEGLINKEMKAKLVQSAIGILSSCPAKEFYDGVIQPEMEESSKRSEVMFEALLRAVVESSRKSKGPKEATKEFEMPTTYFQFCMSENYIFQELVHVTRKTTQFLMDRLTSIRVELDNNLDIVSGPSHNRELLYKTVVLVMWYLRNENGNLEDAVNMLGLGTLEMAKKLLDQGIKIIMKLKVDSGIHWPTLYDLSLTAAIIDKVYSYPCVGGILGHRIITSTTGHRLMIQGMCNAKSMFTDVCVSFDTRPTVAFHQSVLKDKVPNLHTEGFLIVSEDFAIKGNAKRNLMFPYKDDDVDTDVEKQLFNTIHEMVCSKIKIAFSSLFTRFPRLKSLDRCDKDIVMVACILHNYCVKHDDLTQL